MNLDKQQLLYCTDMVIQKGDCTNVCMIADMQAEIVQLFEGKKEWGQQKEPKGREFEM